MSKTLKILIVCGILVASPVLATTIIPLPESDTAIPLAFWQKLFQKQPKLGATITTIQSTDTLSASRSVINTNFSNLNTDKFELADVLGVANWILSGGYLAPTTTQVIKTSGLISTASSTISGNLTITGSLITPESDGCAQFTSGTLNSSGSACGTGSGSGNVATSSSETANYIPFWSSTSATPATLSGGVSGFQWINSLSKLIATNASTTEITNSGQASTTNLIVSSAVTFQAMATGVLHSVSGVISSSLIDLAADITGTLGITNGGTNNTTYPTNVLLGYNGTSFIATGTPQLTAGYLTATSTTASTLPYASTTALSTNNLIVSGTVEDIANEILSASLLEFVWDSLSADAPIVFSGGAFSLSNVHQYPSFTYSTSTTWTGTTTIPLGPAYVSETWEGVKCFTDTGTLGVSFYDNGTNRMNFLTASTTIGTITFNTNNSFIPSEERYVDIGTPASSPIVISCTISKTISDL